MDRVVAKGRRAQYRCSVDGNPCRSDFSRADSLLMVVSGIPVSMSFLRLGGGIHMLRPLLVGVCPIIRYYPSWSAILCAFVRQRGSVPRFQYWLKSSL